MIPAPSAWEILILPYFMIYAKHNAKLFYMETEMKGNHLASDGATFCILNNLQHGWPAWSITVDTTVSL